MSFVTFRLSKGSPKQAAFWRALRYALRTDISLWILLITNVATIVIAIQEQWSLGALMLIYWGQSFSDVRCAQE